MGPGEKRNNSNPKYQPHRANRGLPCEKREGEHGKKLDELRTHEAESTKPVGTEEGRGQLMRL